ncbi:MAG: hypothetical protein GX442_24820 [Candidatus Riflebacteria bacterium]|nr:hypothetical protein [Candidatus Riflebacteria bacterium]
MTDRPADHAPFPYPYPVAAMLHHLDGATDPIARFIQVGNLFEVTLRYLAALTLGWYVQLPRSGAAEIHPRVLAGLARPSPGHWCQVVHALPPRLAKAGPAPIPELLTLDRAEERGAGWNAAYRSIQDFLGRENEGLPRRLSVGGLFDLHVAFRNKTKAHGAIQHELARRLTPALETSLRESLEAIPLLRRYGLGMVPAGSGGSPMAFDFSHPPADPVGALWVLGPDGHPLLPLHPAMTWTDGEPWFLNGWTSPSQVEFLSYLTGRIRTAPCPDIVHLLPDSAPAGRASWLQGIRWAVTTRDPWDVPADAAIMAQDRHRVFGPVREVAGEPPADGAIGQALAAVSGGQPDARAGEVLVSRRPWCAARFLLEAVVYDLDRQAILDEDALAIALPEALRQAGDLGAETIALGPLGTEYGVIAPDRFATLLVTALEQAHPRLPTLDRLIVATREPALAAHLRKALTHALGLPVTADD